MQPGCCLIGSGRISPLSFAVDHSAPGKPLRNRGAEKSGDVKKSLTPTTKSLIAKDA